MDCDIVYDITKVPHCDDIKKCVFEDSIVNNKTSKLHEVE